MKFNLNNISIKFKIYFMAGILTVSLAISVLYAINSMNNIGRELVAIAEEDIPLTNIITAITVHQLEQAINFERALRFGEEMRSEPVASKHFKEAVEKFESISHKVDEEIRKGEAIAEKLIEKAHTEADRKEFEHVNEVLKNIEKEHKEFAEHAEHVFVLVTQNKMHAAFQAAEKVELEEEGINHELESLLLEIEKFTAEAAKIAEHHEQAAIKMLITIGAVSMILAGLVFILVVFGVSRLTSGLSRALSSAQKIADGQLTEEVISDGDDEIGKLLAALGVMRDKLHNMITEMNQSSTELAASSEELATVSGESNQGIQKQQGEIQQAATAMNQMTAAVSEVAKNAQSTSEAANEANKESQTGQQVVKSTVESIGVLATVVDNASTVIQQVGQDSTNIGTVLDVIKSIAEQTNLLALNAAIEAARAGEQGRGFAVVADEVRTLAQRTQESTSEIEGMITRLQESSKNAIEAMESGREQAAKSVELAAKAGTSLEAINDVVGRISDMNAQIASAAEEQTSVAEEVNRNVTVISDVAEQNAAAVNQITASSEELSRMAVNLQDMISQFEV